MRRGPMSEDPDFRTVSAPDEFGWTTESAVRYVPVLRGGRVLGYLWAAVSDDAADFAVAEPASDDSLNASVAWVERLRWAKANGLTPLAALRYWAGEPEDPRAGHVPADSEREAPTLGELKRMARAEGAGPPQGEAAAAFARYRSRVAGCLLGGGLGDALGAPVEFGLLGEIRERYGPNGVTELGGPAGGPAGGPGLITDDSQLTLFTCEGVIGAALAGAVGPDQVAGHVYHAYLRWLQTQSQPAPPEWPESWLAAQAWLYQRRAPGNACLSGLESGRMGTLAAPVNPESKGCGAVMRSAPFGLQITKKSADVMCEAIASAVLTHGHPTGYLAAGAFAVIVRALVDGADLPSAAREALGMLGSWPQHDETAAAIAAALDAAAGNQPSPETIGRLGAGWVAEEALAIGLYAALAHPEPGQARQALLLAVNHSGDSDSTGSVCGNLLGVWHGRQALPAGWLADLEGVPTIEQIAADLAVVGWPEGVSRARSRLRAEWDARYPAD